MSIKWIVTGLLVASAGAYAYSDYQADRQLSDTLQQARQQLALSGQGQFDYADARMSLISNDITLEQVSFIAAEPDQPDFSIASITITGLEKNQQQIPTNLRIAMDDVEMRVNSISAMLAEADAMSLKMIEDNFDIRDNTLYLHYDAEMGYDYDTTASTLDAYSHYRSETMLDSDIALQIVNLPKLDQPLDQLDAEAVQQRQAEMMQHLFSNAGLTRLQLAYRDRGLMDKLYETAAADPEMIATMQAQGLEPTVENLKQTLLTAMQQSMQDQTREVSALEKELMAHLQQFLASDDPSLDITVSSVKPEGLKFSDFLVLMMSNGNPEIASSLVNITIDSGATAN
jgi:hypothetical protein